MRKRGRPRKSEQRVELVKISGGVPLPLYSATQRWMGNHNVNLSNAVEAGLRALPGMAQLEREEQEAYASNQEAKRAEEARYQEEFKHL